MTEISGGEVIARMLQAEGVEKVFGIIDGTYFGFYSSAAPARHRDRHAAARDPVRRTWPGAYARLTGRLGVCMASNGPGVANLLPGLVGRAGRGQPRAGDHERAAAAASCTRTAAAAYQCFDQVGVIAQDRRSGAPPSSASIACRNSDARRCATATRAGPASCTSTCPRTIMNGKVKADVAIWAAVASTAALQPVVAVARAGGAARPTCCSRPRLPMIHAGSGVIHAGAYDELRRVAELLHAPVTTSWAARGVLPETSALAMPMPHVKLNHEVRNDADLVLVVGSRLGETDWWGKAPYWRHPSEQKMIQVDTDGHMLGANKPADAGRARRCQGCFSRRSPTELDGAPRPRRASMRAAARSRGTGDADARRTRQAGTRRSPTWRADELGARRARLPARSFPKTRCWSPTAATPPIWAMMSTTRCACPTRCSRPSSSACSAPAWRRRSARPSRVRASPSAASSATAPWASIRRRSRPRCATGCSAIYLVLCDKQWGMVKMNQQFALKPIKTLIRKYARSRRDDQGRPRRDRLRQARREPWAPTASASPTRAQLRRRDRACARERRARGDPRRRRPGQAHVGARPDALQGDAPRAEGRNERDRCGPAQLQPGVAGRRST